MTRRIAYVANAQAGARRSRHVDDTVISRFVRAGAEVEVIETSSAHLAAERIRRAIAGGADTVATAGGDGSAHLVTQVIAGTDVALGLIPAGTGNDAARALGLPRDSPLAAADLILNGTPRSIDLGKVGASWFLTIMAAGFDAIANDRVGRMSFPRGPSVYTAAVLRELPRFDPISYVLDLDGEQRELDAMLVAVGNMEFYGGGLQMCAGADPTDGLFDIVIIHPTTRLELLRIFPKVRGGGHVTHPSFERVRARSVTVAAAGMPAYADGERLGQLPLTATCVSGALRVYAPQ
ncbi:sphingosine kinase [Nocardioides baekrokdamisoli]|uniref:Sphingosine kinase n=1 Tax=Nocardioides baekrokdamisoli TaxID=1804624 RepID=A0A3G9IZ25_9ACTN|nr:YegS/Rv2252/BmrU family lipid kinase [Nocardioides baekrokdamisoli]BBH15959.1 sphingosine kinase [Nocardioides baekrokdamisoli]